MKFLIDLWLDGYDNEEKMKEAAYEYIYDQLNSAGTSIKILEDETMWEEAEKDND